MTEIFIRRVEHPRGFTIIDNGVLRDNRLSLRARGLMAYLLSLPNDYRINSDRISHDVPEGRDAIRTAMTELEAWLYVRREKERQPDGTFRTVVYVDEKPVDNEQTDAWKSVPGVTRENTTKLQVGPETGKPTVGKPGVLLRTENEVLRVKPPILLGERRCRLGKCDGSGNLWRDHPDTGKAQFSGRCECAA